MSNYPDSFRVNCVGQLPCNNNKRFCDVSKKPIIIENNNVVEEENNKMADRSGNTTTNYCANYNPPMRVIQDNIVVEKPQSAHSWSNQRSYGNIVVGTHDTCNNVHGRVHPYNRLFPLSEPYMGPAVKKDAWALNKVKINRK